MLHVSKVGATLFGKWIVLQYPLSICIVLSFSGNRVRMLLLLMITVLVRLSLSR